VKHLGAKVTGTAVAETGATSKPVGSRSRGAQWAGRAGVPEAVAGHSTQVGIRCAEEVQEVKQGVVLRLTC
jgi:hypothetical protein